jgi:Glycosyltransferases involved in cell wall biogenesis
MARPENTSSFSITDKPRIEVLPETNPAFSIIIPAFNAQNFLEECLESARNQTFSNFEIICIDDGSTDGTLQIMQKAVERDSRIRIIEQQNLYAGVARNKAIKQARGDYLVFLDSDDLLLPQALHMLNDNIARFRADVVLGGVNLFKDSPLEAWRGYGWLVEEHLPVGEVFAPSSLYPFIFNLTAGGPCGKCFKRSFIVDKGISFLALPKSEDFYFISLSLVEAASVSLLREPIYLKRNNDFGLENQKDCYPTIFWDGICALKESLAERGLLPFVEQSRINDNVTRFAYNLHGLKTEEGRKQVLDLLFSIHRSELGLGLYPDRFYYRPDDYYYLLECLHNEFAVEFDSLDKKRIMDERLSCQRQLAEKQARELRQLWDEKERQADIIAQQDAQIESQAKELASAREQINALGDENEEQSGRLKKLQNSKKQLKIKLKEEKRNSALLSRDIEQLRQSNSWRVGRAITYPVRFVKRLGKNR